jgi:type III restriction enzyme
LGLATLAFLESSRLSADGKRESRSPIAPQRRTDQVEGSSLIRACKRSLFRPWAPMDEFFSHPILNSPYEYPARHWELDKAGQPTGEIKPYRRIAEFITPIPKPRKRKGAEQKDLAYGDKTVSDEKQQYDVNATINSVRNQVDAWRKIPNPNDWKVTPETARLLQHWRSHKFSSTKPFFCQIEAAETAIWLSEVAPESKVGRDFLALLDAANKAANPALMRLALKLATGAGKTTVMAIDREAWETLHSDTSRPFKKPKSGRIAVKVINHLGDEVMKVFKVK